jgi:hypothetical protein
MLANLSSHTMIAAQDLDRAKQFYRDELGLAAVERIQGLLVFEGPNGSRFCLFASRRSQPVVASRMPHSLHSSAACEWSCRLCREPGSKTDLNSVAKRRVC